MTQVFEEDGEQQGGCDSRFTRGRSKNVEDAYGNNQFHDDYAPNEKCWNCKFADFNEMSDDAEELLCKRYPPRFALDQETLNDGETTVFDKSAWRYPVVNPVEWCGEFKWLLLDRASGLEVERATRSGRYKCPGCGHRMDRSVMEFIGFGCGCPKCGDYDLKDFNATP